MSISLNNHETRIKALENKGLGQLFPNYSSSVKLANSATDYAPPSNGYMTFCLYANQSNTTYLNINGKRYFQGSDGSEDVEGSISGLLLVSTSDRISWSYNGMFQGNGVGVYFIPAKTLYYKVLEITSSFIKEVLL